MNKREHRSDFTIILPKGLADVTGCNITNARSYLQSSIDRGTTVVLAVGRIVRVSKDRICLSVGPRLAGYVCN
jgi:hypothetical protein